jgi:hypothetical protein
MNVAVDRLDITNPDAADADEPPALAHPCPCCGGRMIIIETFGRGSMPRYQPTATTIAISPILRAVRCDLDLTFGLCLYRSR